jgi:STE24 endopeptidase
MTASTLKLSSPHLMHNLGLVLAAAASDPRFQIEVTEEMLRHSRIRDILYFAGFLYGLGVLALIYFSPLSVKMREAAARFTRRPFLVAMVYLAFFAIVTAVLQFPLSYYSGFVLPHQFDLSNQTFAAWFTEELKEVAIGLVIGCVVGALALFAIRRFRRWWLALAFGSIPLTVLAIIVLPVFIDPLFNKFEPLKDRELARKLLDLADRAGIEGGRVYEVNKSKQTKTMNAYVTGIGPTKRIVMWDTLLAKMSHDEVLSVMGHEMGHYVLQHIWKSTAFGVVMTFIAMFITQRIYDPAVGKRGLARGDPATVPLLLMIVSILTFLASPVINGYSRWQEHQSDVFSLQMTGLNEAMATAFIKLAEDSKVNPRPHPFIEFWRYSHPALGERVEFALEYDNGMRHEE